MSTFAPRRSSYGLTVRDPLKAGLPVVNNLLTDTQEGFTYDLNVAAGVRVPTDEDKTNIFVQMCEQDKKPQRLALLVDNVLDEAECAEIIDLCEQMGYEAARTDSGISKDVRNSGEVVFFCQDISEVLFERLRPVLPMVVKDPYGNEWKLEGMNERFGSLKYETGQKPLGSSEAEEDDNLRIGDQKFLPHVDGNISWEETIVDEAGNERAKHVRSWFTVQLYLNDLDVEGNDIYSSVGGDIAEGESKLIDCRTGGSTRLFNSRSVMRDIKAFENRNEHVAACCIPKCGRLLLFDHIWVHEGQELKLHGLKKYTIRNDVMYSRILTEAEAKIAHGPDTTAGRSKRIDFGRLKEEMESLDCKSVEPDIGGERKHRMVVRDTKIFADLDGNKKVYRAGSSLYAVKTQFTKLYNGGAAEMGRPGQAADGFLFARAANTWGVVVCALASLLVAWFFRS
eukprot:TRINITY_DN69392_c0_g1_i1.p1 TRINITY_DN69392_c0_g1~~TRINITY_DN69392_c0_g1_i1.p1  ORF type:complete len:477 (-),score=84.50 TRINITY_DN69392_c0_g1_i1:106-1464(-)